MDDRLKIKEKGRFKEMAEICRMLREGCLPSLRGGRALMRCLCWALAACLLGICRLPFSVYPLGMAFLCASDTYVGFSVVGLLAAAFLVPLPWGVYLAAVILTVLSRVLVRVFVDVPAGIRRDTGLLGVLEHIRGRLFSESLYLRMTCSCVSVFLLSLYAIVAGGFRYYDLFGAFFSMLVAPTATFFYCALFGDMPVSGKWQARLCRVAKVLFAFSLCLSVGGIRDVGFSLSVALAFASTLFLCRSEGLLLGIMTALLCGLGCGSPYVAILPVVAITGFCLFDISFYLAALVSCMIGGVTGVLLTGREEAVTFFLPLMLGAAVCCMLDKLMTREDVTELLRKKQEASCGLMRLQRAQAANEDRIRLLSDAFSDIAADILCFAKAMDTIPEGERQSAADSCSCFSLPYRAMSDILAELLYAERAEYREDAKKTVAVRDKLRELGFDAKQVSVCGERITRVFVSDLTPVPDPKRLSYLQSQLGRSLDLTLGKPVLSLAGNGCSFYAESEAHFEVNTGISVAAREGVSGDCVRVFENEGDCLSYTLICDGMGTGEEAALTSGISVRILEKLLQSGVKGEIALDMLNGFLRLGRNGGERESSTTADILRFDRQTGKAEVFKCGAPPTYVKRGTEVFTFSDATLPIGILSLVDVKMVTFDVCVGDLIIQISDGVAEGEACSWLLEYLSATVEEDPQAIADHIKIAAREKGSRDDISVAVTKIQQKN